MQSHVGSRSDIEQTVVATRQIQVSAIRDEFENKARVCRCQFIEVAREHAVRKNWHRRQTHGTGADVAIASNSRGNRSVVLLHRLSILCDSLARFRKFEPSVTPTSNQLPSQFPFKRS